MRSDRLWATADNAKRVELIEMVHALAVKYGKRVPLMLRAAKSRNPNLGRCRLAVPSANRWPSRATFESRSLVTHSAQVTNALSLAETRAPGAQHREFAQMSCAWTNAISAKKRHTRARP
jgi:hypothetical protein